MNITLYQNYNPYFQAYEKTFVMLKPDAIKRHLNNRIMEEIDHRGLSVLKEWNGVAPRDKMERNYTQHKNKSFFQDWIDFMVSGRIKALILGGDDAIEKVNLLKKFIRNEFAPGEKRYNLMHSSDDNEAAKREIANFFDYEG